MLIITKENNTVPTTYKISYPILGKTSSNICFSFSRKLDKIRNNITAEKSTKPVR